MSGLVLEFSSFAKPTFRRGFCLVALLALIPISKGMAENDAELEALEDTLLMNQHECTQVWDVHSKKDEREATRICTSFTDDLRTGIESGWSMEFLDEIISVQWVFLNAETATSLSPKVGQILKEQLLKAHKGAADGPMLQPKAHVKLDAAKTAATGNTQNLDMSNYNDFAEAMRRGQEQLRSTPDGQLYEQIMKSRERQQIEYQYKPLCKPGGVSANCRQY